MDENKRRERFKKGVIVTIAAVVLLLVGLLIQGCKSERSAGNASHMQLGAIPSDSSAAVASGQKTISPVPQSTVSQPAPIVSKTSMTPLTATHSATVYVVKSGDTLSHIAKAHGISVKALKSVNGLDNDHIAVGAHLKIPAA